MTYVGVDLHSDNFQVCRLEQSGIVGYQTYALKESDLTKFKGTLSPKDEIAVETTGNTS